jgi:hypothetical protein
MHRVTLNRALNQESKIYGLSYLGTIGAGIIGCLAWLSFGMVAGIISMAVGYIFSAYVAKGWHSGLLQRYLYWHLPFKSMFGGKYLPKSHQRCLL